jgi:hypothetical protein
MTAAVLRLPADVMQPVGCMTRFRFSPFAAFRLSRCDGFASPFRTLLWRHRCGGFLGAGPSLFGGHRGGRLLAALAALFAEEFDDFRREFPFRHTISLVPL